MEVALGRSLRSGSKYQTTLSSSRVELRPTFSKAAHLISPCLLTTSRSGHVSFHYSLKESGFLKKCGWPGLGQTWVSMLMTQSTQATGHGNCSVSSCHDPACLSWPAWLLFSLVGSLGTLAVTSHCESSPNTSVILSNCLALNVLPGGCSGRWMAIKSF